ncbi:MAG: transporter substrate-binding domain-containing protein [Alteromonadaceae bacterium]|nr:transporter substrate-binding domain-containing protein [Alteromonadaceae bacterium]
MYITYLLAFTAQAQVKTLVTQSKNINVHQQTLTIAVNKTTYPYQFVDDHGNVAGLMVDLWKLWAKKQQVKIEFIPLTWAQTLAQVKSGQVDIHAGLAITEQRKKDLAFTSMFFPLNNYFYVQQSLGNITKIEQLAPYTIGVVENSSHIAILKDKYPQLQVKTFPTRIAKYKAALNGDILVFAGIDKLSKTIKNHQAISQLFPLSKRLLFNQWQYAAAVKKNNPKLLKFIEQGFNKITLDEQSAIERKWLGIDKQNDSLLLAFSSQVPPYMTLSPAGKPQGLFVDLWRLWSKYTGQKIDFISEDLAASIDLVKQQSVDVMIAYPESKQVKTGLKKAWHIYQAKSKVYVSNQLPGIRGLSDLNGYTLGLFVTSPYKNQLKKQYPKIKMQYFSDLDSLLNAVEVGDIDAMVSSTDMMDLKLIQTNLQSSFYRLKEPIFTSELYSLVSANNERLAEIIREGFANIPVDALIALEKRWLPNRNSYYFVHRKKMLILSKAEKAWLQQGKTIKVGVVESWRPMEFINNSGELAGINIDIFKLIAKRAELKFKFVVYKNWKKLSQALQEKKIAMSASISPTPEREKYLSFTKPYWQLPWVIIHKKKLGNFSQLKDFHGKKIAIVKGYQIIEDITAKHPQIPLTLVDTAQEGLLALQQGKVDGVLEPLVTASELLKQESLVVLKASIIDDLALDSSHIGVRKDWPQLKSIIDKGILSIQKTEKQHIYEKWFHINISTGFDKNIVMRIALQVGILIFIVIVVIVIWNRRLYQEVNRRKILEEKMKHMATHDELTGLANRALLKEQLANLIALHQRQKLQLAVLFIDLDGFKTVNDTYGHDVGDELLIQLAERLKGSIRTSDMLVRFGGDEFVLVLTGLNVGKEAAFIADKVLQLLKTPFKLSATTTCIGCSIGIALYPDDGATDTELLKVADTLMYRVKAQGKNNYIFNRDIS